jgi:hypothetical protein
MDAMCLCLVQGKAIEYLIMAFDSLQCRRDADSALKADQIPKCEVLGRHACHEVKGAEGGHDLGPPSASIRTSDNYRR